MQLPQVPGRYVSRVREHHQTLADIPQFPDVPRPRVTTQQLLGAGGQFGGLLSKTRRQYPKLVLHQGNYVVRPLPQRRYGDFQGVQAVEQVTPEFPLGYLLLNIDVGGRDYPHVYRNNR